ARGPQAPAQAPVGAGYLGAAVVAGPGFLERGRDPLPAGRPVPVPDASGAARPQGRPPRRPQRYARLRRPQTWWLGRVHADVRRQEDGAGEYLYPLPQLQRAVGQAWPAEFGVRLLGPQSQKHGPGKRDVPEAVCDRGELPADAPGAGADLHTEPSDAVAA